MAVPLPADLQEWRPESERALVLAGEGAERRLKVAEGTEDLLLKIPLRFDTAQWNLIELQGVFPGAFRVTLQLDAAVNTGRKV